jgi:hypothetical protein
VWIPLSVEGGSLWIVSPGSVDSSADHDVDAKAEIRVQYGDILIFSSFLRHCGAGNTSHIQNNERMFAYFHDHRVPIPDDKVYATCDE